jgi:RNA polymerase sigma-70 factor (ECF subfamily)
VIELPRDQISIDDSRLLARAAKSDWESIGTLYDRHRDSALGVAMSVLADLVDAEDVVHDVFMDLPRMARTYDPRRGRPEQWLCRSVRNRAIDHVRRRSRRQSRVAPTIDGPEALLALVPSRAASPADEVEAAEFLNLLGRLEPRYAHLVRLAFVDGWSHSAIARITGIPLGTVKTRLRNSMRQIRAMLVDPQNDPPSRSTGREVTPAGSVLGVSADPAFRRAIASYASGIAPVTPLTLRGWMDEQAVPRPAAVVLDVPVDHARAYDAIGRLATRGWGDVPLLIAPRGRTPLEPPTRQGMTLVLGAPTMPRVELGAAVPALLTASNDAAQRAHAVARLLRRGGPIIAGDRLGRVLTVTQAAASLLGWAPRQLSGTFITALSAMAATDAERHWQELVSAGQWTGRLSVRRPVGPPAELVATAWMIPSGGFIAAIAPDEVFSESAA